MNEGKTLGRVKRTLICLLVTAVVGFVYFYLELPAINLHSPEFYVFAFLLSAVYCVTAVFTGKIPAASRTFSV